MPWVKLDDQFADHPKIVACGPLASWLYVCGLGYCCRLLTDGFIPEGQIRKLADVEDAKGLAEKLVEVKLWERCDGGYRVHDYHDYQPTREKALAIREARAEAGSRGGKQKASNLLEVSQGDARAVAKQNSTPYPSRTRTHPDPSPEREIPPPTPQPPTPLRPAATPPERPAKEPPGFIAFWQAWPKKEGRSAALAKWRTLKLDPDTIDAILAAIPRQQAAKDWPRENWRYCPLPASWLNQRRWEDEVPEPVPEGRELIGKDRERAEVMQRVLARRGYDVSGTHPTAHTNGREVSHQPLRIGDGRLPG